MSPAVVHSPRPLALSVAALLAGSALTAQAETDATDIDTVHVTASQIARQALGTSTITAEDVLEHLRPRVAKWWLPDAVEFIDEVPKTSVGKFSKKDLRTRFADYALPG